MNSLNFSKPEIRSFAGDVVTLQLFADRDLSKAPVRWKTENPEVATFRDFSKEIDGFADKILVTLRSAGITEITASLDGEEISCPVYVHKARHADSEDKMNYYIGDMHAHTSFSDGSATPAYAWNHVKKEGFLNFSAVSDHSVYYSPARNFQNVLSAEEITDENFVAIPAEESCFNRYETNDCGIKFNQGGEILSYQDEIWAHGSEKHKDPIEWPPNRSDEHLWYPPESWDEFFDCVGEHDGLMLGLPHPSDVGAECTMWNGYNLPFLKEPRMKKYLRFVEIINSPTYEAFNMLHERIWSQALDFGYRVCPTAGSDTHSFNWGRSAMWSRTVMLAPSLSKESIFDAMQSGRVYVTESGNVKLEFQVNGVHPGGTVKACNSYLCDFAFDVFRPANADEKIVRAELFSDNGEVVDSVDGLNRIRGNYTLGSTDENAHYFYLRLTDAAGNRTWSSPVWTDNEPNGPLEMPKGHKITGEDCKVLSAPGKNPEKLFNGNPDDGWHADEMPAEILIDLGKVRTLCGMGYYAHYVENKNCIHVAELLGKFRLELSENGKEYKEAVRRNIRSYGGEQVTPFALCKGRYAKLTLLTSVGMERGIPKYRDIKAAIGELSFFESDK